ncbi:dethiobiotin synthase [Psychromonas sp. CNPT3]|uniref:dethiobiotin synthase n=1 Tax=Psychromonas sp. CNPT3 TaxID=314282 RepID=UPI00006E98EB|nr:dethiobiotin synthase [Psychromonas sp. CNPT3]AGH81151.1 dethiobiotin synthase [Psychromonas sp. CNPT3]
MKAYFITGTDTEVGKTLCSRALLLAAAKQNVSTLGYKPIAAGCQVTSYGLRNEDALLLQQASSIKLAYEYINPFALYQPIAPHIAAKLEGKPVHIDDLSKAFKKVKLQAKVIIVEGAGGWRLAVNDHQFLSQWVQQEKLPVILVVAMKLGCLNHAILTYESILADGLNVVGWMANQMHTVKMPYYQQNIDFLKAHIKAPMIAEIPYMRSSNMADLEGHVNFDFLSEAIEA